MVPCSLQGHHGRRALPRMSSSGAVWRVCVGVDLQGGAEKLRPVVWTSADGHQHRGEAAVPTNQMPPQLLEGQRSVGQAGPKGCTAGVSEGPGLQQYNGTVSRSYCCYMSSTLYALFDITYCKDVIKDILFSVSLSLSLIGQCVIIGAGPCGLRTAVELSFMGARVVLLEKRDSFSRNNVLHLWPFTIHDLRGLGAKKFYGKFCASSIDHISESVICYTCDNSSWIRSSAPPVFFFRYPSAAAGPAKGRLTSGGRSSRQCGI